MIQLFCSLQGSHQFATEIEGCFKGEVVIVCYLWSCPVSHTMIECTVPFEETSTVPLIFLQVWERKSQCPVSTT